MKFCIWDPNKDIAERPCINAVFEKVYDFTIEDSEMSWTVEVVTLEDLMKISREVGSIELDAETKKLMVPSYKHY